LARHRGPARAEDEVSNASSKWREQYERIKRWRKRVQRAGDDADDVRDSFFAFTQASYHLVDWLENDKSQPIRRSRAEKFVEESAILSVWHDICNGTKHARLEAKKVKVKDRPIRLGPEMTVWALSVEYQDQSYTASWFAGMCISEWNKFLRANGLLTSRVR
jgi:hypothetical protein